jgi:hypothetical protein
MRIAALLLVLVLALMVWLVKRDAERIDDLSLVLRNLARESKVNVVIDDTVIGKSGVPVRSETKTPREMMNLYCQINGLAMLERGGIVYIFDPKAPTRSGTSVTGRIRRWIASDRK